MHHPTDRITHTTAFVTPVVEHWLEREIVQSRRVSHSVTTISFTINPLVIVNQNVLSASFNKVFLMSLPSFLPFQQPTSKSSMSISACFGKF